MKRSGRRLVALLAAACIGLTSFWSSGLASAAEEGTEPAAVQIESGASQETTAAQNPETSEA